MKVLEISGISQIGNPVSFGFNLTSQAIVFVNLISIEYYFLSISKKFS
jgi:aspartate carbamoyltransferase regulatory subunit